MSIISEVSTDTYEQEVVQSSIPVMLDFTATWCGPCKAVMPILEDVAKEYEGEVRIVKIDVDKSPELAKQFGVRGVPTFIMVNKGEIQERYSAGMTRGNLSAMFERHIGAAK